jgi:hypothetical protein
MQQSPQPLEPPREGQPGWVLHAWVAAVACWDHVLESIGVEIAVTAIIILLQTRALKTIKEVPLRRRIRRPPPLFLNMEV